MIAEPYTAPRPDDSRFDKVALIGMDPNAHPGGYAAWNTDYTRASTSFELLGVKSI